MTRCLLYLVIGLMLLTLGGCAEDQLAEAAREATRQSAEQQRQLVQLQADVARSAHAVVEADAKARAELSALQRDLRQDQAEVGRQRDQLEQDRRDIARQRHRDPLVAAALANIGLTLACLLPLVVCIVILRSLRDPVATEVTLTDFLVHEIVAEQPLLLSSAPRIPALEYTATPEDSPATTEQA